MKKRILLQKIENLEVEILVLKKTLQKILLKDEQTTQDFLTKFNVPKKTTISRLFRENEKIDFGKYKGTTIRQIYVANKGYLDWCSKNVSGFDYLIEDPQIIESDFIQEEWILY